MYGIINKAIEELVISNFESNQLIKETNLLRLFIPNNFNSYFYLFPLMNP